MNILFTPGEDFQNLIGRAEFNLVASRTAQAATLKAEKAGESTVDLAAAKNKGTSSTPTDPSDPTSPGGGGSSTDDENPDSGSDSGSGSGTDNTGGSGSDDPNNTDTPPFS